MAARGGEPVKFRAAVLSKINTPMTIETLDMAPLAPGDVLVRIRASGLCHTDLEVIQGSLAYPLPIVLGHEGAGVVEAVGGAVTLVKPGDHVICSWNPHCGHCFYCERDLPILCEPFTRNQPQGFLLDGASRMSRQGAAVYHFSVTSTHAQYTVVPESGAIPVPPEIPFDRACIIGCGVMTGVGAAVRKAKVAAGSSVAVIGCGAVGLNVIQEVSFRWGSLMGERRIVRSSYGDARPRRDFPWLVREYLQGRLKLDALITRRIRLEEINDGFASLARGEGIRTVILFED